MVIINLFVIYRAGNYRSYHDLRARRTAPRVIIYWADGRIVAVSLIGHSQLVVFIVVNVL